MKRYFPVSATVLGFCFGFCAYLIGALAVFPFEEEAMMDLSSGVALALAAITGLIHAKSCMDARDSWDTTPERADVGIAVSFLVGGMGATPFFTESLWTLLALPIVQALVFVAFCSKDPRSIIAIMQRRGRDQLADGFS